MENFINVMFWLYLVSAILKVLQIATAKYPRMESNKSLGFDLMMLLIQGGLLSWASFIKYWN